MAFGSIPTDINGILIGSVYVPNVGFKAMQGGGVFTDGSSNDSAQARAEIAPGSKQTFFGGYRDLSPSTTATDVFTLTGSASKVVKLLRVEVGWESTVLPPTGFDLGIAMRSTADTLGTPISAVQFVFPLDSASAAATAVITTYSANPTLGTLLGYISVTRFAPENYSVYPNEQYVRDFGTIPAQQPTLRGVAQQICLTQLLGTTTAPVMSVYFYWTEE